MHQGDVTKRVPARVFVGNLPPGTSKNEIRALFQPFVHFGALNDIFLNKYSNRHTTAHFAYIEFSDRRDAEWAVQSADGCMFDDNQIQVQFFRGIWKRGKEFSSSSGYTVLISGLPVSGSWQDLKDHLHTAGFITYTSVSNLRDGTGLARFKRYKDMKSAVKKFDRSYFKSHTGDCSTIRVWEEGKNAPESPRKGTRKKESPDRTRSPSRFRRSRSPTKQRSRSPYSSSNSPPPRSKRTSRSRSKARSELRTFRSPNSNSNSPLPRSKRSKSQLRTSNRLRSKFRPSRSPSSVSDSPTTRSKSEGECSTDDSFTTSPTPNSRSKSPTPSSKTSTSKVQTSGSRKQRSRKLRSEFRTSRSKTPRSELRTSRSPKPRSRSRSWSYSWRGIRGRTTSEWSGNSSSSSSNWGDE